MDNNEKIIQTNAMFTEIFGYEQHETPGQDLDCLIAPPERYQAAVGFTQQIMNLEKINAVDVRKTKNGDKVTVDILGVPVVVKGKKVGGLGIYQDITNRIAAEKQLKENEASYRSLFYDSPIPLIEEDYSEARKILLELKEEGTKNIRDFLIQHPEQLKEILLKIKIIKVNNAAILLYKAKNKFELLSNLNSIIPKSAYPFIANQLETLLLGSAQVISELDNQDLNGEIIHAITHITIAPGYEDSWEKVFVSIIDNTERKINQQYLEYLSTHDQLTGLANRNLLFERLQHAIKLASRNETSIAVFFIDLDGFKTINDLHGHYIGDQLLIQAAKRLTTSLRDSDTISRVGGDEFVLILENFKEPEILPMVADKILKIISRPYEIEELRCQITTSIGISLYPKHSNNPEELISLADTAMYEAKHNGKNQFFIAL
jgi:diguanylate cyclase (GGDEF)-like protein/PAS domain S-box-containing protein